MGPCCFRFRLRESRLSKANPVISSDVGVTALAVSLNSCKDSATLRFMPDDEEGGGFCMGAGWWTEDDVEEEETLADRRLVE